MSHFEQIEWKAELRGSGSGLTPGDALVGDKKGAWTTVELALSNKERNRVLDMQ